MSREGSVHLLGADKIINAKACDRARVSCEAGREERVASPQTSSITADGYITGKATIRVVVGPENWRRSVYDVWAAQRCE